MFKRLMLLVVAMSVVSVCVAKTVRVKGSVSKSGQYREPHIRTSPNRTKLDNYSTKGNSNPYTGKKGTKDATK